VVQSNISAFLASEIALSNSINTIANNADLKKTDGPAILQLTNLQKLADAVALDLTGYLQRINDLDQFADGFHDCKNLIANTDDKQCVWITSGTDDGSVYHNMVTRKVTYSLNSLNLISNSQQGIPDQTKKKALATFTLNFAETSPKESAKSLRSPFRWEASAGAFFSTLPIRSFAVAPVFTNGVITDKKIVQNVLHPTVVPFAAGNFRLTNDLPWGRWKSNFYWTGAVGINPNTVSADFATGLSFAWRALMVSALAHFGHAVELTQGLHVGESLGASFSGSLPTQTYWTTSFAVGVSVRIPSLTGR
jgi:hypothetical protein